MEPVTPIEHICYLPLAFCGGNKSVLQLVRDSGLESLTSESAASVLKAHPALIQDWLRWSEDKRVSSGWYFLQEQDRYVVGFHPKGERMFFQDAVTACSEFIVREVGDVLQTLRSNKSLNPTGDGAAARSRSFRRGPAG